MNNESKLGAPFSPTSTSASSDPSASHNEPSSATIIDLPIRAKKPPQQQTDDASGGERRRRTPPERRHLLKSRRPLRNGSKTRRTKSFSTYDAPSRDALGDISRIMGSKKAEKKTEEASKDYDAATGRPVRNSEVLFRLPPPHERITVRRVRYSDLRDVQAAMSLAVIENIGGWAQTKIAHEFVEARRQIEMAVDEDDYVEVEMELDVLDSDAESESDDDDDKDSDDGESDNKDKDKKKEDGPEKHYDVARPDVTTVNGLTGMALIEADPKTLPAVPRTKDKTTIPAMYAIALDDKLIGQVNLDTQFSSRDVTSELAYWLAEPYWHQGIASAVVPRFVDWSWRTFPWLVAMTAHVFVTWNPHSRRILQKSGFRKVGYEERNLWYGRKRGFTDIETFDMLREHWEERVQREEEEGRGRR